MVPTLHPHHNKAKLHIANICFCCGCCCCCAPMVQQTRSRITGAPAGAWKWRRMTPPRNVWSTMWMRGFASALLVRWPKSVSATPRTENLSFWTNTNTKPSHLDFALGFGGTIAKPLPSTLMHHLGLTRVPFVRRRKYNRRSSCGWASNRKNASATKELKAHIHTNHRRRVQTAWAFKHRQAHTYAKYSACFVVLCAPTRPTPAYFIRHILRCAIRVMCNACMRNETQSRRFRSDAENKFEYLFALFARVQARARNSMSLLYELDVTMTNTFELSRERILLLLKPFWFYYTYCTIEHGMSDWLWLSAMTERTSGAHDSATSHRNIIKCILAPCKQP